MSWSVALSRAAFCRAIPFSRLSPARRDPAEVAVQVDRRKDLHDALVELDLAELREARRPELEVVRDRRPLASGGLLTLALALLGELLLRRRLERLRRLRRIGVDS